MKKPEWVWKKIRVISLSLLMICSKYRPIFKEKGDFSKDKTIGKTIERRHKMLLNSQLQITCSHQVIRWDLRLKTRVKVQLIIDLSLSISNNQSNRFNRQWGWAYKVSRIKKEARRMNRTKMVDNNCNLMRNTDNNW